MSGLYIHIPFCERKCSYCAFYSVVSPSTELRTGKDWKKQRQFFQALEKELAELPPDFAPETIFIGGGTPTAPDFQTLETFFPTLGRRLSLHPIEFSVEVNPGTVDAEKLSLLRKSGVNRISIGVQSFDSDCLEALGRIHSADEAEAAFRMARTAGFKNISLDLMFGVPGQTIKMLESDLDRALTLGPEHIAIYNLMYEEGTPMADRSDRLDEGLEREMYDLIRVRLTGAGFDHYEISNFAKPGFECRHNLLYWTGGEYIGCGPAAHSHWKGTRWGNVADLDEYCRGGGSRGDVALPVSSESLDRASSSAAAEARAGQAERAAEWPRREFEETLDPEAKARETLVMGLRLLKGVEVGSDLFEMQRSCFQTLEKAGLLVIDGHHVRLSEEALFVSDAVFAALI